MADRPDPDPLSSLVSLASRLRDSAASIADRANEAAGGDRPPRDASDAGERSSWDSADFGSLLAFAALVKDTVPDDLRERLSGSFRDALVSTQALIDWYLEAHPERTDAPDGDGGSPS
jgi:hypothetical protein